MQTLLGALWPRVVARGAVTFWTSPDRKSTHVSIEDAISLTEEDVRDFSDLVSERDVYFGLGLRVEGLDEDKQGGKRDIVALPAAVLDIDFYSPGAHKAENLPRDLDEASVLLEGMPDPSAIVSTGNGAHIYWFFDEAMILDTPSRRTQAQKAFAEFQKPIIRRAKDLGWHLDNTASIQRVWRVPGFINRKTNRPVELIHCRQDCRYPSEAVGIKIPKRRQDEDPAEGSSKSNKKKTERRERIVSDDSVVSSVYECLARVSKESRWYDAMMAVLEGRSMAERGERDETLQGVCSTIAWLPGCRDVEPERLAEALRPSLNEWAQEESAAKTVDEELEKATDKIRRSQEDYWERQREMRPQLEGLARALGVRLGGGSSPREGEDEEDQEDDDNDEESESDGRDELRIESDLLLAHAIIQYKSIYWVFDFDRGEYIERPLQPSELLIICRDVWDNGPDDLDLHYVTKKGEIAAKSLGAVCMQYCTVAREAIADMTVERSQYRAETGVFREAVARKDITEVEFDPLIDEWLRLLAGPHYEKVADWVAAVPKLEYQNSALYLDGYSGAGKGMLAHGLARIWSRAAKPTPFVNAIDKNNSIVMRCPLVYIDEGIPGKRGNITAELRSLVGQSSLMVGEKYEPSRPVVGAVRLLICANNSDVLLFGDAEMSMRDLEAVVGRILHVEAREEAAIFLKENNQDGALTRRWVEGGGIARHCLYLAANREITTGKRFLVEGDETSMHQRLMMQGDTNGLVYEWLARYATAPEQVEKVYRGKSQEPQARIGAGQIYVNTQCVLDCWRTYMHEDVKRPTATRIGRVLSRLAHRTVRIGPRGTRVRMHVIRADMVLTWCRQQQIGNEDRIEENLMMDLDVEMDE